jgi:hypothetical protein
MTRRKIPKFQPGEIPREERILLAVEEYKATEKAKGEASFRAIGRRYDIAWPTLRNRIVRGQGTREEYGKLRQRLTPAEEKVLWDYCKQLEKWGAPGRICQLRKMAEELLVAKGENLDKNPLGKNWPSAFLKRHPDLKSMFTTPQDKNRYFSEDYDTIKHFFDLYSETIAEHNVEPGDTYNMDEKGAMMGVIGQQRCIVSKAEKRPKSAQDGNREWVTLIECVSLLGAVLSPWIIFKGKVQLTKWTAKLRELRKGEEFPGHIAISDNGWTDNELGVAWLKECFEPETAKTQKGEWRLLLWDGHSSHISTAAIKFCLEKNIIPLCLPPHTTHLLQPADVGLFGPEATLYKNAIARRSRPGSAHHIDKIDFLEVYCEIRPQALSQKNIEHAWRDVGLFPFNPSIVLSKILPPEPPAKPPLITSNSRPSTAQGAPPSTDLTTPSLVVPLHHSKTPANVAEVGRLLQGIRNGDIEQSLGLEKLAKVAEFSLAKIVIVESQNEDLVEAGKEAQKKKHQLGGDLGRARVMGGKKAQIALEERERNEINKRWKQPFGLGRIQVDIFTWEIASQRTRSPNKTVTNQSLIRPSNLSSNYSPIRPPSMPALLPIRLPIFSPIQLPLRSILPISNQIHSVPIKRRQSKVAVRKARAKEIEVTEVRKETVTHISKRGRLVRHKTRD